MNTFFKSMTTLALIVTTGLQADTFTIYNKSSNVISVQPQMNGANKTALNQEQSLTYNSGIYPVKTILWDEKFPQSTVHYQASVELTGPGTVIVNIRSGGHYTFTTGIGKIIEGTATVRQ
jgi:hypothetical protein